MGCGLVADIKERFWALGDGYSGDTGFDIYAGVFDCTETAYRLFHSPYVQGWCGVRKLLQYSMSTEGEASPGVFSIYRRFGAWFKLVTRRFDFVICPRCSDDGVSDWI